MVTAASPWNALAYCEMCRRARTHAVSGTAHARIGGVFFAVVFVAAPATDDDDDDDDVDDDDDDDIDDDDEEEPPPASNSAAKASASTTACPDGAMMCSHSAGPLRSRRRRVMEA